MTPIRCPQLFLEREGESPRWWYVHTVVMRAHSGAYRRRTFAAMPTSMKGSLLARWLSGPTQNQFSLSRRTMIFRMYHTYSYDLRKLNNPAWTTELPNATRTQHSGHGVGCLHHS